MQEFRGGINQLLMMKMVLACGHHSCCNVTASMNIRLSEEPAGKKCSGFLEVMSVFGFPCFPERLSVGHYTLIIPGQHPPLAEISRTRGTGMHVFLCGKLHALVA